MLWRTECFVSPCPSNCSRSPANSAPDRRELSHSSFPQPDAACVLLLVVARTPGCLAAGWRSSAGRRGLRGSRQRITVVLRHRVRARAVGRAVVLLHAFHSPQSALPVQKRPDPDVAT